MDLGVARFFLNCAWTVPLLRTYETVPLWGDPASYSYSAGRHMGTQESGRKISKIIAHTHSLVFFYPLAKTR